MSIVQINLPMALTYLASYQKRGMEIHIFWWCLTDRMDGKFAVPEVETEAVAELIWI